jgi:hypothetical protein
VPLEGTLKRPLWRLEVASARWVHVTFRIFNSNGNISWKHGDRTGNFMGAVTHRLRQSRYSLFVCLTTLFKYFRL